MKYLISIIGIAFLIGCIILGLWGCPQYNVYSKRLKGEAELAQAELNRQIRVEEAKAGKEAALYDKSTDSIRAIGIAEANKIINASLTDRYIRWKWVEGLHDGSSEIIYVPTEANLPIMEAGRLIKQRK